MTRTTDLLKWKMKRKYGHRWNAETTAHFKDKENVWRIQVFAAWFQNLVN
jgi:hypothetical protein